MTNPFLPATLQLGAKYRKFQDFIAIENQPSPNAGQAAQVNAG